MLLTTAIFITSMEIENNRSFVVHYVKQHKTMCRLSVTIYSQ